MEILGQLSVEINSEGNGGTLSHILSLAIPGVDSEAVMIALKGLIAISNGSASTSASYEPSHVLTAMRLPEDDVAGAIRLSWSHATPPIPWTAIAERLEDLRI